MSPLPAPGVKGLPSGPITVSANLTLFPLPRSSFSRPPRPAPLGLGLGVQEAGRTLRSCRKGQSSCVSLSSSWLSLLLEAGEGVAARAVVGGREVLPGLMWPRPCLTSQPDFEAWIHLAPSQ